MKTEMLLQPTLPTELFFSPVSGGILPYISYIGLKTGISGLKTGMDFRGQVVKRVWKRAYFGLK